MLQVSRNNLKIPKQIEVQEKDANSIDDVVAIQQGMATANQKRFNELETKTNATEDMKKIDAITKIPSNANDLMVVTVVKKLGVYVIAVTEKSPKKFRGVFVNRMQNYCLDTLEYLLEANFIRIDSLEHKLQREEYQKKAIVKLKLLGYVAMVAENAGCILMRQYKQISMQLSEAINLTVAWKKSDDHRWKKRQ